MSQELGHALWECGHARKVTRKGALVKMKIFATVPLSYERAGGRFGLATDLGCFTLIVPSFNVVLKNLRPRSI